MDRSDRKRLKDDYKKLRQVVDAAIRSEDPIGLLAFSAPADEYDPEVGTILPRLRSVKSEEELGTIVHEEFVRWFGASVAGRRKAYDNIAREIWRNYFAADDT
jgi:hypothetical protein